MGISTNSNSSETCYLHFVAIVVAVDLLGGAIHRRRHRRLVPPVRAEGQRHQVRLVGLLRQSLDRPADVSPWSEAPNCRYIRGQRGLQCVCCCCSGPGFCWSLHASLFSSARRRVCCLFSLPIECVFVSVCFHSMYYL